MTKKPNILKDIIVDEVSFVKKGANRKKFLLKKADTSAINEETTNNNKSEEISMMEAILKAAAEVELDNKDAITEAVTKAEISQEGAEAITTVLQILKAAAKDLPAEFYPDLVTLAGGVLPVTEVEKIVEVEVEKKSDEEKDEQLKKEALKVLTAEQQAVFLKAFELNKATEARTKEVEAQLEKAENLRKTAEFITKAEKEFNALPEKAETIGAILKKASDSFSKEELVIFTKMLKAANDAIASREDFQAVGSIGDGEATTAYGRVLAAAEAIRKADTTLSLAKAISKVAIDNPVLYEDYRKEVN